MNHLPNIKFTIIFAKILFSSPDEAWNSFQNMGADYVLVFVAGQRIDNEFEEPLYLLNGGGDESKKQWFMRIAGEPTEKFILGEAYCTTF